MPPDPGRAPGGRRHRVRVRRAERDRERGGQALPHAARQAAAAGVQGAMTAAVATAFFCPRCGAHGADGACSRDGTPRVEIVPGSLLGAAIGNYVIVHLLGEGGMGSVYRAVQPEIGAEVAI